jgi:hypothetical protein
VPEVAEEKEHRFKAQVAMEAAVHQAPATVEPELQILVVVVVRLVLLLLALVVLVLLSFAR